jgi:hypothetical protein
MHETFPLPEDSSFRRGSHHAACWLVGCADVLAREGASSQDIVKYLRDLKNIIGDWREGQTKKIAGNPWTWSNEQLSQYIQDNRKNW